MSKKWSVKLLEIEQSPVEDCSKECENSLYNEKSVAYYAESVAAWYQTKLERDKSILTISAGAIGLMITLSCSFLTDKTFNWAVFILFLVSTIFFAATIVCSIIIFNKNAGYIEHVLKEETPHSMGLYDWISWVFFILGIVVAIAYAVVLLLTNCLHGG